MVDPLTYPAPQAVSSPHLTLHFASPYTSLEHSPLHGAQVGRWADRTNTAFLLAGILMKSEHRHDLETNALAKRLAVAIEKLQPYMSTVIGIAVTVVVVLLGISYMSGASSARQSEAWNTYNQAVEGLIPNLVQLQRSAEDHAGSPMAKWANVTWADGQVWMASRAFLQDRDASMEALNRAESAYRSLLIDADDPQLVNRAHFGLGRVFELRGDLEKARDEYALVQGGFESLAVQQIEKLEEQQTQQIYEWLATARAPRRRAPAGPGTPGERPDFSAGELDMPEMGEQPSIEAGTTVEDLFQGLTDPQQEPADELGATTDESVEVDAEIDDSTAEETDDRAAEDASASESNEADEAEADVNQ